MEITLDYSQNPRFDAPTNTEVLGPGWVKEATWEVLLFLYFHAGRKHDSDLAPLRFSSHVRKKAIKVSLCTVRSSPYTTPWCLWR